MAFCPERASAAQHLHHLVYGWIAMQPWSTDTRLGDLRNPLTTVALWLLNAAAVLPAVYLRDDEIRTNPSSCAMSIVTRQGLSRPHWAPWQIGRADVARADLLLVMESAQKRELEKRFPAASGKTFLYGASAGGDIEDPHGGSIEVIRSCFEQIRSCVPGWVKRIDALNGARQHD
jgi:protein-tyrosine-phosphatase